ncbi:MAG: hypothetical protein IT223_09385 [Crocinitomicaceae bacterium]|nr:hypothetical protein [Crocinitomicaceae bacterium]
MVRIINNEKVKPKEPEAMLNEKSKALLQIIGIIIADNPKAIRELLEEYSIELSESPTDEDLTDKLLSAIGECNNEFNNDLASIILDCTLESSYDSFDFKSLFKKGGESGGEESGESSGGGGGGLWAGIANAVGGIAGSIGSGKRAREEATSKTLQGIYAYKAQLAANEHGKGKNKMYMLIALFVLLGLAVAAIAYYTKKQSQQPLPLKA